MPLYILPRILMIGGLASAFALASDDAPDWLREAASAQTPTYAAKVPAVVLWSEQRTTVEESGRAIVSRREALKVLTREGRTEAYAVQPYETGNSKVREIRAWMIGPSGTLLKLPKETSFDKAAVDSAMYNDIRLRGVDGRDKADPGAVFGFEIVTEEHYLFSQFDWAFQSRLPALVSRYVLTLPAGWRADGVTDNNAGVKSTVDGSTYSWEARDLPFIGQEPLGPHVRALAPRVSVTYFPPQGAKAAAPSFTSWPQVSEWASAIMDPRAQPNSEIAAKARDLTTNSKTEMDRIQAIGWFVQRTKYVSIEIGVERGGGYRPHAASDVLTKEYGDCKDKATLTRALLQSVGIPSYAVLIYATDRTYVRDNWPSPHQFNHAIVAVKVPAEVQAPAVIDRPGLGRMLLFDPTSGSTPAGELPANDQDSLALIAAGGQGELIRTPVAPAVSNLLEREIHATLDPNGTLTANLKDVSHGHSAATQRQAYYSRPFPEFQKSIESWISQSARGAVVSKVTPADAFLAGRFQLETEFAAPGYAQIRANHLMTSRPAIMERRQMALTERERTYPVLLSPAEYHDTSYIRLPREFKVDELPDPAKFETPFGRYEASCEVRDGQLIFKRTLEIRAATVPVSEYPRLREFYERIMKEEQTQVVLLRQEQ